MPAHIELVNFLEIPGSRRFVHRPFTVELDNTQVSQFEQAVGDSIERGGSLTQATLPGGILKPSATPTSDILIPGGWETTRYTFIIKILYRTTMGESIYYITGYTSELDPSLSGYINTDAKLFINSMMEIKKGSIISNINTVLHDHGSEFATFETPKKNVVRVQDVVDNALFSKLDADTININSKFSLDRGTRLVRAEENVSLDYLTKAIMAWVGKLSTEMVESYVDTDVVKAGYTLSRAEEPGWDTAIRILNTSNMGMFNSITYGELLAMDPTIERRTNVLDATPVPGSLYHDPFNCEEWLSTYMETNVASIIATEIPQIMLSSGIVSCTISFDNTVPTVDQRGVFEVFSPVPFSGLNLDRHVLILKTRLLNEVLNSITRNGSIAVRFVATISFLGVSTAEITIPHSLNTPVPYNIPTFATGISSPLIMPGSEDFNRFCDNMYNLEEIVRNVYTSVVPNHNQLVDLAQPMPLGAINNG